MRISILIISIFPFFVIAQNIGMGFTKATEELELGGEVYSKNRGFKLPDGTVRETAGESTDKTAMVEEPLSATMPF